MAETQTVVKEEGGQTSVESTSTGTNQAPLASEGVNTPTAEEMERTRTLYENSKKALAEARAKEKEEREARLALEARLNATNYSGDNEPDDEGVTRFLKVEALTKLNSMANYDPIVRDNFQAIQEEVERNPNQGIQAATDKVLADTMRHILKASDVVTPRPSQGLSPQAMPEERTAPQETEEEKAIKADLDAKLAGIR
jgi:hypothetical protein